MLRHNLGLSREADAIEEAVECALADGLRTPDLVIPGTPKSETCTTKDMGDAIATHTKRILSSNKQSVRAFSSASASSQQREKPLTMFDKIWRDHVVHRQDDGTCLMYVDRHLVHEVTSPQAFEGLERAGLEVRCVDRTLVTADHNVPTTKRERSGGVQAIEDEESRVQVATLEKNVKKFGLKYFGLDDTRQGIVRGVLVFDSLIEFQSCHSNINQRPNTGTHCGTRTGIHVTGYDACVWRLTHCNTWCFRCTCIRYRNNGG